MKVYVLAALILLDPFKEPVVMTEDELEVIIQSIPADVLKETETFSKTDYFLTP